jgi:hypothetical protein
MPQWTLDRSAGNSKHPDERRGVRCAVQWTTLLQRFDHHTVWIEGRQALLLTSPWSTASQPDPESFHFVVSFTYASGHSPAPAEVQDVMKAAQFTGPDAGR